MRGRLSQIGLAFAGAFSLSALASGALVAERLTRGAMPHPGWVNAGMALVAALLAAVSLGLFGRTEIVGGAKGRDVTIIVAQALAAVSAIGVTHLLLGRWAGGVGGWLVEGPRQLVNDAVLVGVILGLVWSVAASTSVLRLANAAACLGLLGLYFSTASRWHLDPFPGIPVQEYVFRQCLSIAAALVVFDLVRPVRAFR